MLNSVPRNIKARENNTHNYLFNYVETTSTSTVDY